MVLLNSQKDKIRMLGHILGRPGLNSETWLSFAW